MTSQNIYEYKKISPLDTAELMNILHDSGESGVIRALVNKINELTIEQNHLMKDFELYKKAFKQHHPDNECDNLSNSE